MVTRLAFLFLLVLINAANITLAQETAVTVFQTTGPSVVRLHNVASAGTGVVLTKEGLILTNAHVIGSPLPFHCTCEVVKDGKRQTVVFEKVIILKTHKELDLALVKIDPAEHNATLGPCQLSKQKAITGQRVYAIGNPGTESDVSLNKTITEGLLSGVDREVDGDTYYQISAAINPGNSGGPLCDRTGTVIGIVTLKLSDADNVGFALPVYDLKMEDFQPYVRKTIDAAKARELLVKAIPLIEKVRVERFRVSKARTDPNQDIELSLKYEIMLAIGLELGQAAAYYDPNNEYIFVELGVMFFLAEQYQSTLAYTIEAIRINSWCESRAYEVLGKTLSILDQDLESEIVHAEGAMKFPIDSSNWAMSSRKLYFSDRYKEATFCCFYTILVAGTINKSEDNLKDAQRVFGSLKTKWQPKGKNDLPSPDEVKQHIKDLEGNAEKARSTGCGAITSPFAKWIEKEVGTKFRVLNSEFQLVPPKFRQ